jgi:hypothetical protein
MKNARYQFLFCLFPKAVTFSFYGRSQNTCILPLDVRKRKERHHYIIIPILQIKMTLRFNFTQSE